MPKLLSLAAFLAVGLAVPVSHAQPIVWDDPVGPRMGSVRLVELVDDPGSSDGTLVGTFEWGAFAGSRIVTGQFYEAAEQGLHPYVEALVSNGVTVYSVAPIICACECECAVNAFSRSFDGGATWELIDTKGGWFFSLREIAAGGPQEWFGLGGTTPLRRSTDDGRTWTTVETLTVGDGERPYTLAADDEGAVAVITTINNGEVTIVYRSSDSGATWQRTETTAPAAPVMVRLGGDVLYGVGQIEGREESVVLHNEPGSTTWTAKPMPAFQPYYSPGGYFSAQIPYDPEEGLLWTDEGLFRETEDGWTREVLPGVDLGPIPIADVALHRQGGVFVEGYAATDDGVLAWDSEGFRDYPVAPFSKVASISASSEAYAWVDAGIVDDVYHSDLFRYVEVAGRSEWAHVLRAEGRFPAIAVAPDGTAYASANEALYRIDEEGIVGLDPPGPIYRIEVNEQGHLLLATNSYYGTSKQGVLISRDRGESYEVDSFEMEGVRDLAFADDGARLAIRTIGPQLYRWDEALGWLRNDDLFVFSVEATEGAFLAADLDQVYRSVDGGVTWEVVLEFEPESTARAITLSADGPFVAVTTRGRLLISRDGGQTWEASPQPWLAPTLAPILYRTAGIAFDAEGYAYAGTWGAGVYRSAQPLVVANEAGGPTVSAVHLGPIYPNPASSRMSLTYALAEPGPVLLTVYDALGRHVATLADERSAAGTHTAAWSPVGLASGVYLVRLVTPDGTATRRMAVVGQ